MVHLNDNRCYVMWVRKGKKGKILFDPIVFGSVTVLLAHAKELKEKGVITSYTYSVVCCSEIWAV